MRTNKWKTVIIKSREFRRLRKNLRTILKLVYNTEINRLIKLGRIYTEKLPSLTSSEWKRKSNIIRLRNNLLHDLHRSVLTCSMGSFCVSR